MVEQKLGIRDVYGSSRFEFAAQPSIELTSSDEKEKHPIPTKYCLKSQSIRPLFSRSDLVGVQ